MALVYLLKRFRFQKNADTEVLVILVLYKIQLQVVDFENGSMMC